MVVRKWGRTSLFQSKTLEKIFTQINLSLEKELKDYLDIWNRGNLGPPCA